MLEITGRDCGHDPGDTAHLIGQVTGHKIHAVGEVFPRSANAFDDGLSTQFSFRADLARHTRHFRCKRIELVHHRVDGVFQFEDLTLDIDGDLFR